MITKGFRCKSFSTLELFFFDRSSIAVEIGALYREFKPI
jgi:hypothetical protein